jgi:hypothetical protein
MGTDTKSNLFLELADYFQNQADKLQVARNSANIYDKSHLKEAQIVKFVEDMNIDIL